jgi:iron complex transport system permease protein
MTNKFIIHVLLLLAIVVSLFCANLIFGSVTIALSDLNDETTSLIFYQIRIPKAFTALFAGSALALCGTLMQTLFRNPLAGPYVLGVSSGAGLFVAIAVILMNATGLGGNYLIGKTLVSVFSIAGALLVTILILFVSKQTKNNITVLLVGIMLSQVLGAFQGLIEFIASPESLKSFVIWGMGSVSGTSGNDLFILVPVCILVFVSCFFLAKPLNAILLSESYARNLGVNVDRLRTIVIIMTAILTGLITAFCGPIAFVGLSVPIASRLLFRTSSQLQQMIYSIFLGGIVLLLCDTICQMLSNSFALPINTVTTLVGCPFVIYLLFKSKLISQ